MFYENDCIFAGFPLDPCDHLRGNEVELNKLEHDNSTRFILFQDGKVFMDGDAPFYFNHQDIAKYSIAEKIFLGKDDDHAYFAVTAALDNKILDEDKFLDLRSIARDACAQGFLKTPSLLARGKMLLSWHIRHRFCANCGAMTICKKGGYVRYCNGCESEHFPRVDPVVIMMVIYKDKCLLGRGPHFRAGVYSALAGFMEPGETIEEATRREVMEEAGIKIGHVQYLKSQPWPFQSSLMIGVIAAALNDDIILDDELEDALWVGKDKIIQTIKNGGDDQFRIPEELAIARHLLEYWVNN